MNAVADRSYRTWLLCVITGCAAAAAILFPSVWLLRPSPPEPEEQDILDYSAGRRRALREGKPMLLFFTGVNNTNALYVELHSLKAPSMKPLVRRFVLVKLYTDHIPNLTYEASDPLAQQHVKWRYALCDRFETGPALAVFAPDPKQAFDADGMPKGTVVSYFQGMADAPEIAAFLEQSHRAAISSVSPKRQMSVGKGWCRILASASGSR